MPGLVHHGPAVDGHPKLAGASPLPALVLKGVDQGVKDGELDGPLTRGLEAVRRLGDNERWW
jgi:hypothetical protein